MSNPGLTARQDELLRFIEAYIAEHGYSPSYEEMADKACVHKSVIFYRVKALVERGYVRKRPGCGRSIEPIDRSPPKVIVRVTPYGHYLSVVKTGNVTVTVEEVRP